MSDLATAAAQHPLRPIVPLAGLGLMLIEWLYARLAPHDMRSHDLNETASSVAIAIGNRLLGPSPRVSLPRPSSLPINTGSSTFPRAASRCLRFCWCLSTSSTTGSTAIIWDRLFGTFAEAPADEPLRFGLADPLPAQDPLTVNFHEWRRLLAAALDARGVRGRLRVLFGPP